MADKALEKIKKVFDGWESSTFVHLNEEQADKFIDYIVDESVLLKKIRVIRMNTPEKAIAKIWIGEKILYPAGHTTGFTDWTTSKATPSKIKLVSKKCRAKFVIGDDELEDNIEWQSFKDHLMRMAAKACANQLEDAALYWRYVAADWNEDSNCVDIRNQFDWFIEKAQTVIDAASATYADRYIDVDKLTDLRLALKSKYRPTLETILWDDLAIRYANRYKKSANTVDPAGFAGKAFLNVPLMSTESAVIASDAVNTTLASANTQWTKTLVLTSASGFSKGDTITIAYGDELEWSGEIASISTNTLTMTEAVPYWYEGWETVAVSSLNGAEVLMADPRNLIQGIQRDVKIEFERDAEHEQTAMYISIRTDFQVENPEAVAVLKGLSTSAAPVVHNVNVQNDKLNVDSTVKNTSDNPVPTTVIS